MPSLFETPVLQCVTRSSLCHPCVCNKIRSRALVVDLPTCILLLSPYLNSRTKPSTLAFQLHTNSQSARRWPRGYFSTGRWTGDPWPPVLVDYLESGCAVSFPALISLFLLRSQRCVAKLNEKKRRRYFTMTAKSYLTGSVFTGPR